VTTSGGTVNFLPLWDSTTDITSSVIFQSGSGSTAKIGINNASPAATLDVKGSATIRGPMSVGGTLTLPATGAATSSGGKNSQPLTQTASSFNSSTNKAVNQTFEWLAEPVGNDTASPSGKLNLLFGSGVTPTETGLSIASTGQITFATGQTFLGAGTVTSVATSTGLTGGPITTSGTLQIDPAVVPELGAASNTFTGSITASSFTGNGAGLTNVNAATLNGQTAGSFATLGANTFGGTQTISTGHLVLSSGNLDLSATGVINIGVSNPFAIGTPLNQITLLGGNAFLGYAGNVTTTGSSDTATGVYALGGNTTGSNNTASGADALAINTSGNNNTAYGSGALMYNLSDSNNTAVGYLSGPVGSGVSNATAIGANAVVGESNALVLGSGVDVGVGTSTPAAALHINGPIAAPPGSLPSANNGLLLGTNGTSSYKWIQTYGGNLALNPVGNNVGIGTESPDNLLSVNGSADKPGGGSWGTFSDRRLKNLDGSFRSGLNQIMKINPVLYRYKEDNALGIRDHEEHVGLVAQDVQKVIPEAVSENGKGYLLVNNDPIIWAMLNAIKEQQKQIAAQQGLIRKQTRLAKAQQVEIVHLRHAVGVLQTSLRSIRDGGRSPAVSSTETSALVQPSVH
jgi:hypothetical protein